MKVGQTQQQEENHHMPRTSPLFQQRHYEWLAAWLRDNVADKRVKRVIAQSLAYHLARDNPKFKEQRFLERSGNGSGSGSGDGGDAIMPHHCDPIAT